MIVQIYEVSTVEEARACAAAGVDHVGVLVGPGAFPRELSPAAATLVLDAFPDGVSGSALTLSGDLGVIGDAAEIGPDILHLGAAPEQLSVDQVKQIKRAYPDLTLMRSIPVTGLESVDLARFYDGLADFLLLDSHEPGDAQVGALGRTHDWSVSRRIVETVSIPCILAGGLGPDNVAAAIRKVAPAGVDSKTRTDIPGSHNKDMDAVRRFVQNARG